jgi:hypothetical protein
MKVPWMSGRVGRKRPADDDAQPSLFGGVPVTNGEPLLLPVDRIEPDSNHPRREGDEAELDKLAADIAMRGVLQPIVVAPADAQGRQRLWFGGQRLKAAVRAELSVVPVVITSAAHDGYAQVAENLKRANLSPMTRTADARLRPQVADLWRPHRRTARPNATSQAASNSSDAVSVASQSQLADCLQVG